MLKHSPIIGIVVGETSGDILGAGLMHALKLRLPNAHFVGISGSSMQSLGFETWYKMEELELMGVIEVLKHIPRLLKIRKDLIFRFIHFKINIFIGIDAPDFNISLENQLKKYGIPTIHYVSPSIWAWRQKRIYAIKQATNLVLLLFPFEKILYDRLNIPYRFIGHAIADIIPLKPDRVAARIALGIHPESRCLALLPGSRRNEISMLSIIFLKTAQELSHYYPDLKVIVPLINKNRRKQFESIKNKIAPELMLYLLNGKGHEAMIASNAALLASGTATLECMLAKCPMVVGYRMKSLNFLLAKYLVKTSYISLPNLLADREIVPELLQNNCIPDYLTKKLIPLLKDNSRNTTLKKIFLSLHKTIRCNANHQAAQAVLDYMLK
ncbi:Lipid-A-disaccharide synthase [Candidatus Ecksteinia adelgidicola]|nr:Lipid-A-disaccharide synthase [Candidatus Ecksteinia adelgidicola]